MSIRFYLLGLMWLSLCRLGAQPSKPFYNFEYQAKTGKVILKLDRFNEDFILVHYFASGIGSNDIGFDRGKIGGQKLVQFRRMGNKVLLVENNTQYRAESPLEAERKAVTDAFASSIIFGFVVEKDTTDGVYIDLAPFIMEDHMGATLMQLAPFAVVEFGAEVLHGLNGFQGVGQDRCRCNDRSWGCGRCLGFWC